jgi:hypothetical protein
LQNKTTLCLNHLAHQNTFIYSEIKKPTATAP